MKKQVSKFIFFLLFVIGVSNLAQSQSSICDTSDIDYCTDTCMIVDSIENNTDCDMTFIWLYQGYPCSGVIGAGTVSKNSSTGSPSFPWNASCRRFCDYPCECPTGFWLIDPNDPTKQLNPWSADWAGSTGTVTSYCLGPCSSCGVSGSILKVTMTITGTNRAVFKFECVSTCP